MKVSELIKILEELQPDTLVVLAKDSEGNGFSPLAEADGDNNVYVEDANNYGEVELKHLTKDLERQGYTEEDLGEGKDCVVLWPTN